MSNSYRASSIDRKKKDHYPTYFSLVWQLLEKEQFPRDILEPCCGEYDAIGKVLREKGYRVSSCDLWFGDREDRQDFLCRVKPTKCIITNPPFKLANDFMETALRVVSDKFAFLLPLDYLHGQSRYNRFYKNGIPLKKVYILTRRPYFGYDLRIDGKYPTGSTSFAWFIFEKGHKGKPLFDWIDNNRYVLKKEDL